MNTRKFVVVLVMIICSSLQGTNKEIEKKKSFKEKSELFSDNNKLSVEFVSHQIDEFDFNDLFEHEHEFPVVLDDKSKIKEEDDLDSIFNEENMIKNTSYEQDCLYNCLSKCFKGLSCSFVDSCENSLLALARCIWR